MGNHACGTAKEPKFSIFKRNLEKFSLKITHRLAAIIPGNEDGVEIHGIFFLEDISSDNNQFVRPRFRNIFMQI